MGKWLRRGLGILTMLSLIPATVLGQLVIEITGGGEAAVPIAVIPFDWQGNGTAPEDIAGIIGSNLRRSGQFSLLSESEFSGRPTTADAVDHVRWQALGVDFVVVGRVQSLGSDDYSVTFQLVDVFTREVQDGRRYRVAGEELRLAGHVISNKIHEEVIGEPGVFDTRIAYVGIDGDGPGRRWQLMLADADGHSPTLLEQRGRPLMSPSFSPDGTQIAYVSFESRESAIHLKNVFSGENRPLITSRGLNSSPAWSPDGRMLAYAHSGEQGATNIYLYDLQTGSVQQLTRHWGIDTEPAWSADGRSIYFTSDRGGSAQIYRVAAEGGRAERVSFEGSYNAGVTVSPRGTHLAMVHRNDNGFVIALQNLADGRFRVLTTRGREENPEFSPDGSMILYTTTAANGQEMLETVSVYGGHRQAIRQTQPIMRSPAWSPR